MINTTKASEGENRKAVFIMGLFSLDLKLWANAAILAVDDGRDGREREEGRKQQRGEGRRRRTNERWRRELT